MRFQCQIIYHTVLEQVFLTALIFTTLTDLSQSFGEQLEEIKSLKLLFFYVIQLTHRLLRERRDHNLQ